MTRGGGAATATLRAATVARRVAASGAAIGAAAVAVALALGGCRPAQAPPAGPAADRDAALPGTAVDTAAAGLPVDPAETAGLTFDATLHDVAYVVDGDTLHVRRDGRDDKVRLLGINAPETGDGRRDVQCFGREARSRMRALLDGRRVYLATDPAADTRDRYGRLLAYVWRDDGLFVNLAMLSDGFANEYTFDRPYHHRARFRAAAREARAAGRGLWAPETCDGDFDASP